MPSGRTTVTHDHALEAVARLAGGVAHDFNNILLALRAYGELALRRMDAGADPRSEVLEMLASAERASALTRRLLAFGGRHLLRPEVVDLNEFAGAMDESLASLLGPSVTLTLAPSAEPARAIIDRRLFEQVLLSLTENAKAAMPDGGRLTIAIATRGSTVELAVTDTGHGMDDETAMRALEPFFTTRGEGATGLGLATARGIVTQSGGTLGVESQPGVGTTIRIELPIAAPQSESERRASGDTIVGGLVLLVEDDEVVRRSIGRILEEEGFEVASMPDGEAALLFASARRPDVVLTDVSMAGLGGRETAEGIHARHPGVPVVFMSGYTDDAPVGFTFDDAWTAFLQKPFSSTELIEALQAALSSGS
jgi:hypothetical protein